MGKIHYRRVIKLGNKRRSFPVCGRPSHSKEELKTTTDKKEITCNMCRLIVGKES